MSPEPSPMRPGPPRGRGSLVILLGVLLAVALRFQPVEPRPATDSLFSAEEAMALLGQVLPATPHPTGSEAQARFRARLVAHARARGLEPEIQSTTACSARGMCSHVHNVVVRLPGSASTGAVLLMAHYDSARSSPGAGDDGQGVAIVLQLAERWRDRPHENDLIFLLDDGEEDGLLGAEAFAAEHRWARDVRFVINLEGRGSTGPSWLFETGPGDAGWLPAWAGTARRPAVTSVARAVYAIMPNYTDLSVFTRRGVAGANFAFSGGASSYHAPLDTLDRLSPGAVQEQGDHAATLLELMASRDLATTTGGGAVVAFDVLGVVVVRWPRSWTLGVALLAAALLLLALARHRRSLGWGARQVALGATTWLALSAMAAACGWLMVASLRAVSGEQSAWAATPAPAMLGLGLGVLVVVTAAPRKLQPGARRWGAAIVQACAGIGLATAMPDLAYPFVVPLAATMLGVLAFGDRPGAWRAGLVVALVIWLPLLEGIRVALGFGAAGALGFGAAQALANVDRLPGRKRGWVVASMVATGATLLFPAHDASTPRRVRFVHVERADRAQVLVLADASTDAPPDLPGRPPEEAVAPWLPEVPRRAVTGVGLPAPRLGEEGRVLSPRGADRGLLVFGRRPGPLWVNDAPVPAAVFEGEPPFIVELIDLGAGLSVSGDLDGAVLVDVTAGLPSPWAWEAARGSDAIAGWDGDETWVVGEPVGASGN